MTCPDCGNWMRYAREPHPDFQYPFVEELFVCDNCGCTMSYHEPFDDGERIDFEYQRSLDFG